MEKENQRATRDDEDAALYALTPTCPLGCMGKVHIGTGLT
jgi:hypothetical protein